MEKAKAVARGVRESVHELPRRFQQDERADNIRVDEGPRPVDGAVNVRLGGQVEHRRGPFVGKDPGHGVTVGDVRLDKRHTAVGERPLQIEEAPGIRQFVDDHEAMGGVFERVMNQIGPDEPSSASDQESHLRPKPPPGT